MASLCELRFARKDLQCGDGAVFSYLIKLIWKGIFMDRIRLLLIQQIGNGSISFNYQGAFG